MYLWLFLEDTDKKTMMRHAAIHSKEGEPGGPLYDTRRSLAKKYGVEVKEDKQITLSDR